MPDLSLSECYPCFQSKVPSWISLRCLLVIRIHLETHSGNPSINLLTASPAALLVTFLDPTTAPSVSLTCMSTMQRSTLISTFICNRVQRIITNSYHSPHPSNLCSIGYIYVPPRTPPFPETVKN
ncbi:hypothetical protein ILYODFUR_029585 [Ilyodon furcidens]|uniref:Uncharacterized protein n=1 Tax=Ilyodon furcidens TaxID=33524 RepID=A0ABV0VA20_9TELE